MSSPEGFLSLQLLRMSMSFMLSRMLYVAAVLEVADRVRDQPKSSRELARETGVHAASLERLLGALVAHGVFRRLEDDTIALNPLSAPLCRDHPASIRPMVLYFGADWHQRPWMNLLESIRTGDAVFERCNGAAVFDYFSAHPEAAEVFEEAMGQVTRAAVPGVLASYDFGRATSIVDVGGGDGALLGAILRLYPATTGVLVDLPRAVVGARRTLAQLNLIERCQFVEGDLFDSLPKGGDVYLLKNVLHDWDDDAALAVLRSCHRAMTAHTRLLILEVLLRREGEQPDERLMDLSMLLLTGGRERSQEDYRSLCEQAGLLVERVVPTRGPYSLLEVRQVDC